MRLKFKFLAAVLLLPALFLMVRIHMRSILYPDVNVPVRQPPAGYSEVRLETEGRGACIGWYSPGRKGPALLYFHGNGENLETLKQSGWLDQLQALDTPVLAVDYPGYGRSAGKPTEAAILKLADASVQWLQKKNPAEGWVCAGWSLGAAVAIQAASRNPEGLKGLVVLSGWSSLQDVAEVHFPEWLVHLFLSETYDSVAAAGRIHCPVLLIHGERDDLIPVGLGERLSSAFAKKRWIRIPDAGHNDLLSEPRVYKELATFVNHPD